MKIGKIFLAACFIATLSFCKKEDKDTVTNSDYNTFLKDDTEANTLIDDIDNEVEDVELSKNMEQKLKVDADSGRDVTFTSAGGVRKLIIVYKNYDNPNTIKKRIKNGKIIVTITGNRISGNYKRVVELDSFMIDDKKVEGTRTVEQLEEYKYKITLTNGKITFADGKTITHNFVKTRAMIAGFDSPLKLWDDVYSFEGSANGVNKKGFEYTKTIIKPIIIHTRFWCPVQGSFNFEINGKTLTLDYGDGQEDSKVTITMNGVSKEVIL